MNSGFNLNFNEFTYEEQDTINYACQKIKQKNDENKTNMWLKFFNKGFKSLGKGLNAIGKIISKKGI